MAYKKLATFFTLPALAFFLASSPVWAEEVEANLASATPNGLDQSTFFDLVQPAPRTRPLSSPGLDARPKPTALAPLSSQEVRDVLTIRTVDLTSEPRDVWERMRNGFAIPDLVHDTVTSHQVWFLNRSNYLRNTFERGRRYFYFILEELEKRDMPAELALLPMVESSYNPMAISPAQASGMWQFIPSTGRTYGLKQDWWVDQRRDILASTSAALDYLQTLYEMQGDWQLALASYNWGEGAVARSMARNQSANKPLDYMSLNMPAETRNYYPKLQALKNIILNPELFGITLPNIPNRPYFKVVPRPADMDVSMAAKLAETSLEEFRALNASHNRPVLRANGASKSLLLPADKVNTFYNNLERTDKPLLTWQHYTVGPKENITHVAKKFNTTPAELRRVNSLKENVKIRPGYSLLVPSPHADGKLDGVGLGLTPPPEALAPPPQKSSSASHSHSPAPSSKAGKNDKTASSKTIASKSPHGQSIRLPSGKLVSKENSKGDSKKSSPASKANASSKAAPKSSTSKPSSKAKSSDSAKGKDHKASPKDSKDKKDKKHH